MNKYTLLGLFSWLAAGCTAGFQGIKSLMNTNYVWHDITLWDLSNSYIRNIPNYVHIESVHNALQFIIRDFALYQLLAAAGLIFFIIGNFLKK